MAAWINVIHGIVVNVRVLIETLWVEIIRYDRIGTDELVKIRRVPTSAEEQQVNVTPIPGQRVPVRAAVFTAGTLFRGSVRFIAAGPGYAAPPGPPCRRC